MPHIFLNLKMLVEDITYWVVNQFWTHFFPIVRTNMTCMNSLPILVCKWNITFWFEVHNYIITDWCRIIRNWKGNKNAVRKSTHSSSLKEWRFRVVIINFLKPVGLNFSTQIGLISANLPVMISVKTLFNTMWTTVKLADYSTRVDSITNLTHWYLSDLHEISFIRKSSVERFIKHTFFKLTFFVRTSRVAFSLNTVEFAY